MHKKMIVFSFFAYLLVAHHAYAMKKEITVRCAQEKDIPGVVDLMNTEAIKDNKKIVILPEAFRRGATAGAIKNRRLFVALDGETPVAYKKAFMIEDAAEKAEILRDEVRCRGGIRIRAGHYDGETFAFTESTAKEATSYPDTDTYIYTGGDFTHRDYRTGGINKQLTDFSFNHLKESVQHALRKAPAASKLALVYGLTNANAGESGGIDRTPHILKSFVPLVKSLGLDHETIHHERFKAFMPTFDPKSIECRPLPDSESIPGYGCVLSVPVVKGITDEYL